MEEKTLIELLLDSFKKRNIASYPPAIKKGTCHESYIVVKSAGAEKKANYSSQIQYYDILMYVPMNEYTSLDRFKERVKQIIDEDFYPRLMFTGTESEPFYDDEIKAYMVSIMYRNNVRNRHL